MQQFSYFQPTRIHFGCGRLQEIGGIVAEHGRRCLLVSTPQSDFLAPVVRRVQASLAAAGVAMEHFDGVVPNPTTDSISAGAAVARRFKTDVILGLGGGSSMDSAKAIAVEATHEGTAWDYLFFKKPPTEKTLPIVAVSTTSGTGSQVTQVAVMTEPKSRCKSAIYHPNVYPRDCIVDPELMITVPPHVTSSTGFDAFCHSFESYLHPNASPLTDLMALDAIRLVARHLETAIAEPFNLEARSAMAWADTLAGLCIANAGVTLPHGVGMAISGMYPQVMHGESLAIVYPQFTRFTWQSAVERFACVARIIEPKLTTAPDAAAAQALCELLDGFLQHIGMWLGLADFDVPVAELPELAEAGMVLPDYKNNPRLATADEMLAIVRGSFARRS